MPTRPPRPLQYVTVSNEIARGLVPLLLDARVVFFVAPTDATPAGVPQFEIGLPDDPATRALRELAEQKAANPAVEVVRRSVRLCDYEDCDQEPKEDGFCALGPGHDGRGEP